MEQVYDFEPAEDLRAELVRIVGENRDRFAYLSTNKIVLRRRISDKEVKWIARISLVPKRFADLFDGADYIIEFDSYQFDHLTAEQKEAIIFHELCHTFMDEKGRLKLIDHDIKEFLAVIEKYGGFLPDRVLLMNTVKRKLEDDNTSETGKQGTKTKA